jgi:signal transduction histidine kinase
MMRIFPQSLKGQLIAATLLAVFVSQLLAVTVLLTDRRSALYAEWIRNIAVRAGSIIELLEATPPEFHDQILKTSATRSVRYSIGPTSSVDEGSTEQSALLDELREALAGRSQAISVKVYPGLQSTDRLRLYLREIARDLEGFFTGGRDGVDRSPRLIYTRIAIQMNDQQWLNVTVAPRPYTPPAWPLIVQMMATAILAGVAIVLVINRMTKPLKRLAAAAAALGRGEHTGPLVEDGPSEVAETIRAFNEMQDRLTRFIHDRTKMLAAIGHDLRTPITSLRLRAEFIEDEETRGKILETLDDIQQMAEATLSFAREEGAQEETRLVDIGALVASVCEDLADTGKAVECQDFGPLTVKCRPFAMKRALRNVVENAVAYGQSARVSVASRGANVMICVEDDGPGIPQADMERVFKPFVRLEVSRSRSTGGVGLGLAISRSILRGHGGDIVLENRSEGGLRAKLILPGLGMTEPATAERAPPPHPSREAA